MQEQKTITIDLSKRYVFPQDIRTVRYEDYILVISVDEARWIVLKNEQQVSFFESLRHLTIENALSKYTGEIQDAKEVILQIEAKDLFGKHFVDPVIPNGLHIYLTNKCNMMCPHCYMYAGNELKNELTTDEVQSMLYVYKQKGGLSVTLSGGETTLRSDLFEIVKYGSELGLIITILTNGTLWTDDLIKKISEFVYCVQISIDGYNEEENSKVRGKGSFEKALTTLEKFLDLNVLTTISCTPMYSEDIESKADEYASFGRKLVEKYHKKKFKMSFNTKLEDGRNNIMTDEKLDKYASQMELVNKKFLGEFYEENPMFLSLNRRHILKDNCTYGFLYVAANGDVYACSLITQLSPFANIREKSFEEIMIMANKLHELSNVNNLKPCNQCELKYICGGDCRIKNFEEFKDADLLNYNPEDFKPRQCNIAYKESFYRLMIKYNQRLFE